MSKDEVKAKILEAQILGACDTVLNSLAYMMGYNGSINQTIWDAIWELFDEGKIK